jgi:hypothetical protein
MNKFFLKHIKRKSKEIIIFDYLENNYKSIVSPKFLYI